MNNREKRQLEKRMGLHKYYKTLTREQKFEMIRQNIAAGKKKQEEMREIVRLQKGDKKDEIDSNKVASIATELMIKEGLSYIEALEKAKKSL